MLIWCVLQNSGVNIRHRKMSNVDRLLAVNASYRYRPYHAFVMSIVGCQHKNIASFIISHFG